MDKFLHFTGKFHLANLSRIHGNIQPSVCLGFKHYGFGGTVFFDILGNNFIEHFVRHKEITLADFGQGFFIPCIFNDLQRRAIVSNFLLHFAPVDVL